MVVSQFLFIVLSIPDRGGPTNVTKDVASKTLPKAEPALEGSTHVRAMMLTNTPIAPSQNPNITEYATNHS